MELQTEFEFTGIMWAEIICIYYTCNKGIHASTNLESAESRAKNEISTHK